MLISLLFSVYSVYLVSLLIGFSRLSIFITFSIYLIWFLIYLYKKKPFIKFPENHLPVFVFAFILFIVYFVALFPGIFSFNGNYIVMSAENWQDTAMHMGITESITQGNFPPQAPYFSGAPLSYYYFIDFHAAIIETLSGQFLPKVFVYLNPFFIALFAVSVYALAYTVTKNKLTSLLSSFLSAFYGNFMSLIFFKDLFKFGDPLNLLATRGYTIDYYGTMSVSPMADYFLQNRPMMIGLPAFTLVLALLIIAVREKDKKILFLVGLIASLMVKFQLFTTIAILLTTSVGILFFFKQLKPKLVFQLSLYFILGLVPGIAFLLFLKAGSNSFFDLIRQTFQYQPWGADKSLLWKIQFLIDNFGIELSLLSVSVIFMLLKKIQIKKELVFLFLLFLLFFGLPFVIRFTIYDADMFKFFYLAIVPVSILASFVLSILWRKTLLTRIIVVSILIFTSLTCFLDLGNSYFNKNFAYSIDDYETGLWIRNNTPQKSIFIESPKVHSAVTEIGGRLRILSYITWPFSHGFNTGPDNVFSRLEDIKTFYTNPNPEILEKYAINYVYLSSEEKNNYKGSEEKLNHAKFLTKVYEQDDIEIFKVNL